MKRTIVLFSFSRTEFFSVLFVWDASFSPSVESLKQVEMCIVAHLKLALSIRISSISRDQIQFSRVCVCSPFHAGNLLQYLKTTTLHFHINSCGNSAIEKLKCLQFNSQRGGGKRGVLFSIRRKSFYIQRGKLLNCWTKTSVRNVSCI